MERFFLIFLCISCINIVLTDRVHLLSDPFPSFETFVNDDLAEITDGILEFREKSNGEFGLFAKSPISKGAIIMSLPKDGVFTSFDDYGRSYYFYEMARKDHKEFLVGRLVLWKFLVKMGFLYDYYLRNPHLKNINDTILLWPKEDFEYFVKTSGFYNEEEGERPQIEKNLKSLREINDPFLDKYEPKFTKEMFDQDLLLWVMSLINQKAFPFSQREFCILNGLDPETWEREIPRVKMTEEAKKSYSKDGYALIPYFDLFDGEIVKIQLPKTVRAEEEKEKKLWEKFGIEGEAITVEKGSFTEQKGFDFVIKSLTPKNFREYWVIEEGNLHLKANRDYKADEEVKYFKGFQSNSHLLRNFGHINDDNFYTDVGVVIPLHKFTDEEKTFFKSMELVSEDDLFNKNLTVFRLHDYQINYNYVAFIRVFLMKIEEIVPAFNETKTLEVIKRGRFKNAYLEMLVWYNYYMSVDFRKGFQTSIAKDRRDLNREFEKEDFNELKVMILKKSIQQKHVVYKHLFGAMSKWVKLMHHDINTGFLKKTILEKVIDPKSQAIFFYSEID